MKQSQKYEAYSLSRKKIIFNNFLGGISWAFGTTIGLTLILGLGGFIVQQIGFVPVIGEFVLAVSDFVTTHGR